MRRLTDNRSSDDDEMIQQLLDIIFMDKNNPKYDKYKSILMDKYGVDWEDYLNKEEVSLDNIKSESEFISWDEYKEYSRKIYKLRGGVDMLPYDGDGFVTFEQVREIGDELGYKAIEKPYSGRGDYASVRKPYGDEMRLPKEGISINVLIHELGHVFDFKMYGDGISKTLTNASTPYGMMNGEECIAENFKHYFLNPRYLKDFVLEVYKDLDKSIPKGWKSLLKKYIKISSKQKG